MPGKKKETDEERAARRDAEAATAALVESNRKAVMSEELRERAAREDGYMRTNLVKIHSHWRRIMRLAKTYDLLGDFDTIRQAHERALDRKVAIIQMLDADLDDAEEQWLVAVRGHKQLLERLQELQRSRLQDAKQHFMASLQDLKEESDAEQADMVAGHTRARKEALETISAMEREHAETLADARQEFEEAREEMRNRASEEYNVLKLSLEGQIAELEAIFKATHQTYLHDTQERSQAFKQLTKTDAEAAGVIEARLRKLGGLGDALAHWRAKISSGAREWEARNRALGAEKAAIARHHRTLDAAMRRFRSGQAARLRQLTLVSTAAEKELQAKLDLAEKILHVGRLCQKHMTEEEQIQPFCTAQQALVVSGSHPVPPAEDGLSDQAVVQLRGAAPGPLSTWRGHAVDASGSFVPEWNYLDNLHRLYNKVLLEKVALEQESSVLEEKVRRLRTALQSFLDGVSVTPSAVDAPSNTLLNINGRLQRALNLENTRAAFPGLPLMPRQPLLSTLSLQATHPSFHSTNEETVGTIPGHYTHTSLAAFLDC